MRKRSAFLATCASALACVGIIATAATAAYAAAAMTIPAPVFTEYAGTFYPITDNSTPPNPLPFPSGKGVSIGSNCPPFVKSSGDPVGFNFLNGNAVIYRITANGPSGGNAEGLGQLIDANTGATPYFGQTHVWFGFNQNPNFNPPYGNLQQYFGEAISFHGTATDGSTIDIQGSGGGGSSASGNPTGWGHIKVTCTGPTS